MERPLRDTVQELFQLSNGGAVRLTTGRWSDSLDDVLNEGRVVPQFEVILTAYQSTNRYQLSDEDDPQLQTALDRINTAIAASEESSGPDEDIGDAASDNAQTSKTDAAKKS